ncbi:dienelactone hydrolase family protein [Candidatus Paracaedibacter symbiosus]|uniref:dienelactone hydrolase family protein n=1 Tax=Candidatus Paracaedibacter symbiosus TaxID=244582 RepID=UPI00068F0022|nr:dienelactone hydrolase family protein [Candidatus Paracaedibacter symbiosus]
MAHVKTQNIKVPAGNDTLELLYAFPEEFEEQSLPTILVLHTWSGRDSFVCDKASYFASQGFLSIAVDLFGDAKIGKTREECQSLIHPFVTDRKLLKERLQQVMDFVQKDSRVDPSNINAIGYCFGGLCVLDMVRTNMGLKAGITIHGILAKPDYPLPETYTAKVIALHGYKDPMVLPQQVAEFQEEMKQSVTDWQMMIFGQGLHGFTKPGHNDETIGVVYNPLLDQRTTKLVNGFLEEISQ